MKSTSYNEILSILIVPWMTSELKGLRVVWSKIEIHYRPLKPVKNGALDP